MVPGHARSYAETPEQRELARRTGQPFWSPYPEAFEAWAKELGAWDVVLLGGKPLPGKAAIKGASQLRIEVQKVNGRDGGTIIERGYTPGEFDIDLLMWTAEQWASWQVMLPSIYRRAGKLDANDSKKKPGAAEVLAIEKRALSITHPATASMNIFSAVIQSVAMPADGPVSGTKVVVIKCLEYVPAAKFKGKDKIREGAGVDGGPITPPVKDPKGETPDPAANPSDAGPPGGRPTPQQGGG
jgi:hypothetical protein